jgi:hypothetical protein
LTRKNLKFKEKMDREQETKINRWLFKSFTRMENFDYLYTDIKTYEDFIAIELLNSG